MKAGQKLDSLIAEKVMGLKKEKLYAFAEHPGVEVWRTGSGQIRKLPEYCADMTAAWEIMEKLKELEPEIIWKDENKCWYVIFWKAGVNVLWPLSPVAPMAICLAALKAMGINYTEESEQISFSV